MDLKKSLVLIKAIDNGQNKEVIERLEYATTMMFAIENPSVLKKILLAKFYEELSKKNNVQLPTEKLLGSHERKIIELM